MLYSVALAFLYGATDEFHQSFTPGRGPKFTDVLIDTFGATIFLYGIVTNIKRIPRLELFLRKIDLF
jgi:VanZ family protein